ncbi:MAG TPA: branched-chain amino acid ABC transporter permease [Bradyrhizobium sp.]|nr:branched-chain amino acid ABC transporter permease [Bradyrhizobium sp.]
MYWINTIIQGALIGGLYALFATGLSLMFGVMRIINLAHGDFIVLSAYLAVVVTSTLDIDPFLALLFVVPLMFALGYVLQRGLLNFTLGGDILRPLLVTFGLSIVVQNLLLEVFSADSRRLQAPWLETASLRVGEHLAIGVMPAIVFVVAVATIVALEALLYWTDLGRAFRATSDDSDTARLYGVNNRAIYAMATAIALAAVSIAGVMVGIRTIFDPTIGPARLLYAFEVVIIGGLGSLWGTLAGGIILGVAQALGGAIDPSWDTLAGHVVFLIVLLVRPGGLFPRTFDQ